MDSKQSCKIRPAGRHLLTIGRDLIQDTYAAVVELVKNAYDADSPDVLINFEASPEKEEYTLYIIDHGHGMSMDTVVNKWMVPSTTDKMNRRTSPSGRVMQGRKGVGRFAASILGKDLLLESVTKEGKKTSLYVDWSTFETAQYLDDVEILVDETDVNETSGTKLTISGTKEQFGEWSPRQFAKLRFELKKLLPPVTVVQDGENIDDFEIQLKIANFKNIDEINETIVPYPIFDLYDYRISGTLNKNGVGGFIYSTQKARNTISEDIQIDLQKETGCGELFFDIRVYDRDSESIESLIGRGLKDGAGSYVGINQAKNLLNDNNGLAVYRNGFRIRPLGDPDFDWLLLNARRVQNPSRCIGSNQVIGFVRIESEESSNLIEKSARDGLRENFAFDRLKAISLLVILELETRRFQFRMKAGLSRPVVKIEKALEELFSSDEVRKDITKVLTGEGASKKTTEEILTIIDKDNEKKNQVAEQIRQAVAVYQGQVTLGKIITVIIHEGRKPLSFFKNQIPNLYFNIEQFKKNTNVEQMTKIISITNGIAHNSEYIVRLFERIDPLAMTKRSPRKELNVIETLKKAYAVYENELSENKIAFSIIGNDKAVFNVWVQDIYTIFTNLIDNSIYWINDSKKALRKIEINIVDTDNTLLYIDYFDSGSGIEKKLIESGVIFEPNFSTKPIGMGLGLAIAGESADRNGFELKVLESDNGAYFRLQTKDGKIL